MGLDDACEFACCAPEIGADGLFPRQGQEDHFRDNVHPLPLPGSFLWGNIIVQCVVLLLARMGTDLLFFAGNSRWRWRSESEIFEDVFGNTVVICICSVVHLYCSCGGSGKRELRVRLQSLF